MTEKRFTMKHFESTNWIYDNDKLIHTKEIVDLLNKQHETIQQLEKQCTLMHMSSMFSTVKSFKGNLSKRYKYDEETNTIYDTANKYGQYSKVLDKKEIVMLLNEYETLLKGDE